MSQTEVHGEIVGLYLSQVQEVLQFNFVSQVLMSLGAAFLTIPSTIFVGSTPVVSIWFLGFLLFLVGGTIYVLFVYVKYRAWKKNAAKITHVMQFVQKTP